MFATLEPTIRQSCIRVLSIPNSTQQKISRHKGSGIELPYDLRPSFFIFIILFAGCSPVAGDYPRVVIMVEKYPDDSPWDFHSRSSRQAEISKKTWEEYILYKEQTCRTDTSDSSTAASDYFNWEEMTFHRNLRLKLLPSSLSSEQIGLTDAMMLSKIDGRLLAPEAQSLCRMGMQDDTEQIQVAEKDKFEDTLISRLFRNELRASEPTKFK
uniref:Uncharacterized protein n=1 Tax=Parascaris univalens TaxID=6257 RepID=A0A915BHA1_PARUN